MAHPVFRAPPAVSAFEVLFFFFEGLNHNGLLKNYAAIVKELIPFSGSAHAKT